MWLFFGLFAFVYFKVKAGLRKKEVSIYVGKKKKEVGKKVKSFFFSFLLSWKKVIKIFFFFLFDDIIQILVIFKK